jgi:hypothetical protein
VLTGMEKLDLEAVVSLEMIRLHCKLDDIGGVSDPQLALYRRAAFEAAEQYTGRAWTGERYRVQSIASKNRDRRTGKIRVRLDEATVDGVIVVTGGVRDDVLAVSPGTTEIMLPVYLDVIDVADCCNGCDTPINYGLSIRYKAGACKADDIPAGIVIGVLKFIAWNVENPGDTLITVNDGQQSGRQGISGTNNGTWGSGAIEQWRQYRSSIAA